MRCGSSVRYPHTKQPETFGDFWFTIIFLPFRGSGRVDPLRERYTKKTGEPPPFSKFLFFLFGSGLSGSGDLAATQLGARGREFDQFGEVFGWVSATDWGRLGGHWITRGKEIGARSATRSGRGDRFASGSSVGWVVGWLGF
jgi:hypothetical protein